MLDEKTVKKIAALARIKLTDEEVKKFANQLANVFEYMELLKEVNTENVKETNQVTGLSNVKEKDEVKSSQSTREEMLDCSELPVDSKQIRTMDTIK